MKIFPDAAHPVKILHIIILSISIEATPAIALVGPAQIPDSLVQMIGCDVGVSNRSSKPVVVCTNPRLHVEENWD